MCDAYDLDPARDVVAHREWAPDRKIDPAGQSAYADGGASWDMNLFRHDVATCWEDHPPPDELTGDEVNEILEAIGALDTRLSRVETWLQQIDDKIDADRVNDSNRYKTYAEWHADVMGAMS